MSDTRHGSDHVISSRALKYTFSTFGFSDGGDSSGDSSARVPPSVDVLTSSSHPTDLSGLTVPHIRGGNVTVFAMLRTTTIDPVLLLNIGPCTTVTSTVGEAGTGVKTYRSNA